MSKDDSKQKGEEKMKKTNGKKTIPYHCYELFSIPPELFAIEDRKEQEEAFREIIISSGDGPFPPNSLTVVAPISFVDEMIVIVTLTVCLGGPLVWIFSTVAVLIYGSWTQCAAAITTSMALAFHPLPSKLGFAKKHIMSSRWTLALYKYFSYRYVGRTTCIAR